MARSRASANYKITATDKASGTIRKVKGRFLAMNAAVGKLTGGLSLAGVVTTGVFAQMYKAQAPVIDNLAKTSDKLGIATEQLQAMRDAADRAGISTGNLDISLQRMARRVSEAAQGTGEASKALKELGIDAAGLSTLDVADQFDTIKKAIDKIPNATDRVRLAFKFFDSGGVDLVNLKPADIEKAREEIERLGLSISRVDAASVEQANDSLQRAKRAASGLAQQFTIAVSPAIDAVVRSLFDMNAEGRETGVVFSGLSDKIATVVGILGEGAIGLKKFWYAMSLGTKQASLAIAKFKQSLGFDKSEQISGLVDAIDEVKAAYFDLPDLGEYYDNIKGNLVEVRKEAQATADALKDASGSTVGAGGLPPKPPPTSTESPYKSDIDAIRASLRTETQAIEAEFIKRHEIVQKWGLLSVDNEDEADTLRDALASQKRDELNAIKEREEEKAAALRDQQLASIEGVKSALRTETEAIQAEYNFRLEALQEYGSISATHQAEADTLQIALSKQKEEAITAVKDKEAKRKKAIEESQQNHARRSALGALQAVSQYSKKAFKLYQAASAADAVISAYKGAAKSLAAYELPYGAIIAASHLAMGFAQVRNITSASPSGTGGGGSISTAMPANPGDTSGVNLTTANSSTNEGERAPQINAYFPPSTPQAVRDQQLNAWLDRSVKNESVIFDSPPVINQIDDPSLEAFAV